MISKGPDVGRSLAMDDRSAVAPRARTWPRWLLFATALLFFLGSLLTVLSAPTSLLWIAAILLTEWGHYAALLALLVAWLSWGARGDRLGMSSLALAFCAALLFATPLLRALLVARTLPARCDEAFGAADDPNLRRSPLSLADLFRGIRSSGVFVTEHVFSEEGGKQLRLDLYQLDDGGPPRPIVLMLHGGSWNSGGKEQLPALNHYLAQKGYAVAAIEYRHAPKFPSPAQVDDVFQAIAFLRGHTAELRLDATRMVVMGRSAGGQIALSAAYAGREPAIRGAIGFYAPADLVLGYEHPSRPWVLDSKRALENYLQGSPSQTPEAYAAASPLRFVNGSTPPTLLLHGQLDPIVWPEQSELLAARLKQEGRPHLFLSLPWATHGCDAILSGPSGQLSLYAIERFLAAAFR